jgi:hypothetical protein
VLQVFPFLAWVAVVTSAVLLALQTVLAICLLIRWRASG